MSSIWVVSEYTSAQQNSTGYFWERAIDQLTADGMGVKIITLKKEVGNSKKSSIFHRLFAKCLAAVNLAWSVAQRVRRGETVFSGTNPEILFFLLALLKPVIGFRWHVLVHDVFPENLIPAEILKKENFLYRMLKLIFDWVYAQPDQLFVIGRDMKFLVDEKTRLPERSFFIHNWVDSGKVVPSPKADSELVKNLGWENKTVFQFFGNIGRVQGIRSLLDAISLVKSDNAAFLFIGSGVCAALVSAYQKNNPEKSFCYLGEIPQEKKDEGLSACDVALITLEAGMYGLGVPSKAYFSMAAGRPILAVMDTGSEVSLMVEEEKIGWHCISGSPITLANLIDSICQDDLTSYSVRSRKSAEIKYSDTVALAKLSRLVKAGLT